MLATGDVTIDGTVSVSGSAAGYTVPGEGGPGGFAGGYGGGFYVDGGKGFGPGGGNPGKYSGGGGGGGGFGTDGYDGWSGNWGTGGSSYGNQRLLPITGGSGGGGGGGDAYYKIGTPGGGGGGAIVIASSTSIVITGEIRAYGGSGYTSVGGCGGGGGGSGGAIKLVAGTISGNGAVKATGGYHADRAGNGGLGRIRIEADSNYRTAATDPPYTFGAPTSIFLSDMPTLSIDTIAGTATPANPTGNYNQPDMMLPNTTTNPVTVAVSATNVPLPANVDVWVIPQYGNASSYQAALSGSDQSSSGSAGVTLSTNYSNVIMAETTFAVQQAMYFDGEKIEKVRVAATAGEKSRVVYITESGKEVSGELLAGLARQR